ncbi:MAG: bifunctional folylpolyglutamate synthase/dihydrofolate synthase [bacterium]|nr:bifunctional folylpolyglutamate synthase/dihydrofolate synthase [bacterium]
MNYTESLELLTSQEKFHINLGLDRIKKVAQELSNPQEQLKIIHIAGTNGKGSTCAMLAKILEANGYKTGLYTSPHIKNYTERIKINFNDISQNDFAKYIQIVETASNVINIELTEFEILTLAAFLYFRDEKVDYAVMETGMGGRLDATNIVSKPTLTIITSISKDHTDRLGSTTEEIAAEKAGIIKPDVPIIVSDKNLGFDVIKKAAAKNNAELVSVNKNFSLINPAENIFSDGEMDVKLSLLGINQGENLALALKAAKRLNLSVINVLENITWQGRFEYQKGKNLVIDAAHNPDGVMVLRKNLDTYFKDKKRAFLFGMLDTKDYKNAIKNLFKEDDRIFITDNFAHNSIKKEILLNEIKKEFPKVQAEPIDISDLPRFMNYDFDGIKICCGSFYLIANVY